VFIPSSNGFANQPWHQVLGVFGVLFILMTMTSSVFGQQVSSTLTFADHVAPHHL